MAAHTRRRWTDALASAWSAIGVAFVAGVMAIAAVVWPGYSIADVELNDGAVYVVKSEAWLVGQFNSQIDQLATAVKAVDQSINLHQSGDSVLVQSISSNQIQAIDFATGVPGSPVQLPQAASVVQGGGTLAVVNPTDGRMWTGDRNTVMSIDFAQATAPIDLGEGGQATVTTTGQAIGLSIRDQSIVRLVNGDIVKTKLPWTLQSPYNLQISAVGDKAVVLDRGGQQVWVEGNRAAFEIQGVGNAQLAAPTASTVSGSEEARAVLANSSGLVGVGRNRVFSLVSGVNAEPGVPLVVDGCAYGVFANGRFAKACTGSDSQLVDIPEFDAGDIPVFRTNRGVVVLNSSRIGYIWLVNKGMLLIKDWGRVTPATAPQRGPENETKVDVVPPNREINNRNPVAEADPNLAARAGRTTLLPVMDNDFDPDGDIITVLDAPKTSQGAFSLVRGGTGLQLYLPLTAKGPIRFQYTISDGRGGRASATATVKVLPPSQKASNQPPVQKKKEPLVVPLGASATKRVLLDWMDPDGDDLVLVSAKVVDSDDEIDFTADGTLNYRDVGTKVGRKEIEVVVSDGVESTTGVLVVDARKGRDIQPVANGDYYSTTVNQEIVLRPLLNDVGEKLILARVNREGAGFTTEPNYRDNSIRFSAKAAGTYYIRYIVTNGFSATGIIRVDVIAPVAQNRPPVAARDTAVLPNGGSVLIDPLANDEDPDGDVLVLQSVTRHPSLRIVMEQRHLLRITAISRPSEPVTLNYRVSDGYNSVTGTIIVIPAPGGGKTIPVAVSDDVTVRANDTATINVLRNDYSPIGVDLRVDSVVEVQEGAAWVDGETVRFTAPSIAGQYRLVYRIRDTLGQEASAQVRFNVVAADVENQAPKPALVIGRVLANSITKISVPLEGIDPNGDSVRLLGLNTGPSRGRIVSVGDRWIEYQSYGKTGTDAFEYQVTDSRGLIGIGTIRVGIVPRETDLNTPPVAMPDEIAARPGRQVRLAILANDSDPDGDSIRLNADNLEFDFPVKIVNNTDLSFTMPGAGRYTGQYTIIDARGAMTTGIVTVISDPNAPLLPPVTTDDQVLANQIAGKSVVDVPVLENDYDPDNEHSALTLSIPGGNTGTVSVATGAKGPVVRVHIATTMQLVRYEVTDSDGLKNWGIVVVPGTSDTVPSVKADIPKLKVVAGKTLSIPISDYVVGTAGRSVSLASDDRIWATNGRGVSVGRRTIEFAANSDYVGPGSVVFEVTDGRTPTDTSGRKAVISLSIEIEARPAADGESTAGANRLNRPPLVAGTITVDVGQGEPDKLINLDQYVSDPDGDPISFSTFESGSATAGLNVSFSPDYSVVTTSAALSALPGAKASWHGLVRDTRGGESPMTVEFVITESTRPRPTVVDDELHGDQGKTSVISALANDHSNLLGDTTLTIVGAELVSGEIKGEVSHTADSVTVTPADSFLGELRIRYTVQDATKAASRQVDGFITLTVRGRPSRPGVVVLESIGNSTLGVTWTASSPNGHPITTYTVTARGGADDITQDCPATTCTITGLANGTKYKLTVVAVNSLGASEASAESAEMMPDVKPHPPSPVLKPGDGKIEVHWDTPMNPGTGISTYTIELSGWGPVVLMSGTPAFESRSYTFSGLVNGTQYGVRMSATNNAGESDFSPLVYATPAALPGAPEITSVSDEPTSGDGKKARLTWVAPGDGGSPILDYQLYVNDILSGSLPAADTSATINVPANGTTKVQLAARNNVGIGPLSNPANTVVFGAPSKPSAYGVTQGVGTITLRSVTATSNGKATDSYNIELIREADAHIVRAENTVTSLPWTVVGLDGGTKYHFRVQACAGTKCSAPGTSGPYTAFTAPAPPTLVFGSVIDAEKVKYGGIHSPSFNGAETPVVLYVKENDGLALPVSQTEGGPWTRDRTITGHTTVTAWAEGETGGPSGVVTLEIDVPMSIPVLVGDRGLKFDVHHQQDGVLTCSVTPPGGGASSINITVLEHSGTGSYNQAMPLASGQWTVTCGPMTRTINVP